MRILSLWKRINGKVEQINADDFEARQMQMQRRLAETEDDIAYYKDQLKRAALKYNLALYHSHTEH